jgi:hypothetical protein
MPAKAGIHDFLVFSTEKGQNVAMKTAELSEYLEWAETRRAELAAAGLLPPDEALRNRGLNRTEEKRELLRRVEARAKAAGVTTMKAYY